MFIIIIINMALSSQEDKLSLEASGKVNGGGGGNSIRKTNTRFIIHRPMPSHPNSADAKEPKAGVQIALSSHLPGPQDGTPDNVPFSKRSEENPWTGCPSVLANRTNSQTPIC